jgi:hypothetical protein
MNKTIEENLKIVLDFVERWNKLDTEEDVAQACVELEEDLIIKPMATDYSDSFNEMFRGTTPEDLKEVLSTTQKEDK